MTNEQLASSVAWSRHWVKGPAAMIDPSKERMHEAIAVLSGRLDRAIELLREWTAANDGGPYLDTVAFLAEVDK